MKKNTNVISNFLYYLLYTCLLSGIVVFVFSDSLGISDFTWGHGIVLFLSIVFFAFMKELNRMQRICVTILGMLLILLLFLSTGIEKVMLFAQSVLYLPFREDWGIIDDGIITEERILAEFVWLFLVVAAVCVLQSFLLGKKFFLKVIFAFAIAGGLLYALFSKQELSKIGVAFSILYCVLIIIEWVQVIWKKQNNERLMRYILWLMPFLILYTGILCLMPTPEKPYNWQWVKELYLNAEEKMTMYIENIANRKKEDMDTAVSGFSEETGLFAEIKTEQKNLMNIRVKKEHNLSLYLAGKVYDSFDGRRWESLNQSSDAVKTFDTLETVYALERYAENSSAYYKDIQAEVEYQFFHTNYLLAPSKTWEIVGKEKSSLYHQEGATYVFDLKAGYGTEYLLQYCQLNMDREKIIDFLQCNLEENEAVWEKTVKKYAEEKVTLEELSAYRESVRAQYLKNIELSPEVKDWLATVTADAATDVEKLYCIERALSSMAYNTKPGGLPETVTDAGSFLSYFLLEKREGYCSYFATAFVLLAQAEGLPARYVQGFCIPIGNEKETMVYSGMAHAWPEVYIEGKGWIPFEPTPGYGAKRYIAWKEAPDRKASASNAEAQTIQTDITEEEEALEESPEEPVINEEAQNRWVSYIWKTALFILATGIVVFAADIINEKRRDKRRTISEKYKVTFLYNLQILAMLGYEKEETETYHELIQKIRSAMEAENECEIPVAFIEAYEHALYGTEEIREQTLESCLTQKEKLLAKLKQHMGKKYLLGRVKLYVMRYR